MSSFESKESRSNSSKLPIAQSISVLQAQAQEMVTVRMWASKMGYEDTQSFSDEFRQFFEKRPQPVLMAVRTKKAISLIRQDRLSNFEVALELDHRDEKGLYQFIKRQTAYSPSQIKSLPEQDFKELVKKLDNIISE